METLPISAPSPAASSSSRSSAAAAVGRAAEHAPRRPPPRLPAGHRWPSGPPPGPPPAGLILRWGAQSWAWRLLTAICRCGDTAVPYVWEVYSYGWCLLSSYMDMGILNYSLLPTTLSAGCGPNEWVRVGHPSNGHGPVTKLYPLLGIHRSAADHRQLPAVLVRLRAAQVPQLGKRPSCKGMSLLLLGNALCCQHVFPIASAGPLQAPPA